MALFGDGTGDRWGWLAGAAGAGSGAVVLIYNAIRLNRRQDRADEFKELREVVDLLDAKLKEANAAIESIRRQEEECKRRVGKLERQNDRLFTYNRLLTAHVKRLDPGFEPPFDPDDSAVHLPLVDPKEAEHG